LVQHGLSVCPYDVRTDELESFLSEVGGVRLQTPAEIGKCADVIITILPTSKIVGDVLFGSDGVAPHLRPGTVVVDMTSGLPASTIGFAEKLAAQNVSLFDAPVSGG